jgi:hypothetical protein
MFEQNKKKAKPLSFPEFVERYFGDKAPNIKSASIGFKPMMFDESGEVPESMFMREAKIDSVKELKNIERGFGCVAKEIEGLEEDIETIEDRLDAMQAYLKLEYVAEEVTGPDGYTKVNKFMRKVPK